LIGPFERATEVFVQEPHQVDQPCPYTLSIPVELTEDSFDSVRITLDQSILGLGWNQIDAVELVGEP
jgi:autotransporter translocation and assembly factor TamB